MEVTYRGLSLCSKLAKLYIYPFSCYLKTFQYVKMTARKIIYFHSIHMYSGFLYPNTISHNNHSSNLKQSFNYKQIKNSELLWELKKYCHLKGCLLTTLSFACCIHPLILPFKWPPPTFYILSKACQFQ